MKITNNNAERNIISDAFTHQGTRTIQYGRLDKASEGCLFLEENVLFFVEKGTFKFSHGEQTFIVEKHQIALFKKDILLQYRFEDNEAAFMLFILSSELIVEFAKLTQLNTTDGNELDQEVVCNSGGQLLLYIASLQAYFQGGILITDSLTKIKLLELLFCLSTNNQSLFKEILDVREQFRPNITCIVEENITNSLSLRQLARLAGRSVSSFRRDFLYIYNMPPSRWIRLKRLEKAQQLLANTNMTVTDICYTLGFESIAHFSRIFKSNFGYPPSEMRGKIMVA